ncbi:TRAP transporter small permease [Blautia sp. MSJ-19]|uniref:TRAP transporter small permease n=1 Tax=Blautia sp. MSJ-19 TaxID=2841517 RepID=UPI001C0F2935|nr:TRAP transporter small permease [Blautia sp. MSJ-19]MBU5480645.1 TRAP transporter small permease [Blautia sp. MSJ-19]
MGKEQADEKHGIKFFEGIYKVIECVSALCLCGQVVIISIAVIGRYIFSYTPTWSEEIARVLMVWMSFLTASMAIKDDTHVRISVFDKFFGEKGLKIRDTVFSIINIIFSLMLFWEGSKLVMQTSRTKLPGSGISSGVLYASICVGGLFMAVMLIYRMGARLCQRKQ